MRLFKRCRWTAAIIITLMLAPAVVQAEVRHIEVSSAADDAVWQDIEKAVRNLAPGARYQIQRDVGRVTIDTPSEVALGAVSQHISAINKVVSRKVTLEAKVISLRLEGPAQLPPVGGGLLPVRELKEIEGKLASGGNVTQTAAASGTVLNRRLAVLAAGPSSITMSPMAMDETVGISYAANLVDGKNTIRMNGDIMLPYGYGLLQHTQHNANVTYLIIMASELKQ